MNRHMYVVYLYFIRPVSDEVGAVEKRVPKPNLQAERARELSLG